MIIFNKIFIKLIDDHNIEDIILIMDLNKHMNNKEVIETMIEIIEEIK